MSVPGGGDITELLRRLGDDALVHEAESHGLAPRAGRLKCPWPGCEDKGPERERDAVVFASKHPRIYCYACQQAGDLVDLLQRTRAFSKEEALAHVRGVTVPERPRPELRVVGSPPADEEGKLKPAEVQRLWDSLERDSELGRKYLEGRGLGGVVDAGLVRFAAGDAKAKDVAGHARRGFLIAGLLTDVVGNPRGVQLRLAREARAKESKIISAKGSVTSRAFFGRPHLIESAPVVLVAEGLADTLAAQLWAPDTVVVGAAGKSFLPRLADELEAAGIELRGKLFALFVQNDAPLNQSRREFTRLKQRLQELGARVCWVATPAEFKDVAEWRHARPDVEWPPAELQRAFLPEPGDEAVPTSVLPEGLSVPVPLQVRTERYANDFTTLCALLDDVGTREAVMGRGELSWCEMTTRVRVGGRQLAETDLSTIRLGLEAQARSTDGKPLKFGEGDIEKALTLLARRKPVHQVREWLHAAQWDGKQRLEVELPGILGHAAGGFEARLLRRWFVSAVARAEVPGCKVDTVLILTGGQGVKKSTFFEALGGPWFTDSRVEVGDKDGLLIMREAWIVEWGELEAMKRARSAESTKAFLSARVDMFRRPYGRDIVRAPRHCVIVGTTNETEILGDATGSRRFWPVEVKVPRIDVRWLHQHRTQLFAEARALYTAASSCPQCRDYGERCDAHRWWLADDEEAQLDARNKAFEVVDVWQHRITDWLEEHRTLTTVTVDQVLKVALDVRLEDMGTANQMRVGKVLRQLGWKNCRVREGRGWRWVWERPEELTP